MSESPLKQVQEDVVAAMKAGDRELAGMLRMIVNALQQEEKSGDGDAVAVLQRERKRRLEAARAYEDAGNAERAQSEKNEAQLIERYMPEQLSADELEQIVDRAIESQGASTQSDVGRVMGAVMAEVKGRADGGTVSGVVRAKLGGGGEQ